MDIRVFRKMLLFFLPQNSFILPVSLQVIVLRHLEAKMLIGFFTLQAPGSKAVNSAFSPCKKKHRGCGASFFCDVALSHYALHYYIITLLHSYPVPLCQLPEPAVKRQNMSAARSDNQKFAPPAKIGNQTLLLQAGAVD